MAVSVALRNKKLLEAGMDGGGDTTCERCAIGLIRPGRPGETRRINHARVEYILPPSWGGDRTTKNCALLCGQCKDELKFVKERVLNFSEIHYKVWCKAFEGTALTPEQDLADAYADGWDERAPLPSTELDEHAISKKEAEMLSRDTKDGSVEIFKHMTRDEYAAGKRFENTPTDDTDTTLNFSE